MIQRRRWESDHLPRVPWTWQDVAAATGMALTASLAVGLGALTVQAITDDDTSSEILSLGLTTALLLAVTFAIGLVSKIRLSVLVNVTGMAIALAIAIQVMADSSDPKDELFAVPLGSLLTAVSFSMFLAIALLYGKGKYKAPLSYHGFKKAHGRLPYLQVLGAWMLAWLALGIWAVLIQNIEWLQPPDNASEALESTGENLFIALPLVGLFVPLVEETFFRGFLLAGLRNKMGPIAALALSSAIFALFHIHPGLYVPTFVLGVAIGWVYLRTGSVWPSVVLHAVHNSTALILTTYLDVES